MAPSAEFDQLLHYLRDVRGFDFTGYKPSSLERRMRRRMEAVGIEDYDEYRDHLEVQPDEFGELFNTILINVTALFRDKDTWALVASRIVPEMLAAKEPDAPIRVWSAGCASGEEAYTLAVILSEALGEEQFQARVKIYGTDVDEHALEEARTATYDDSRFEDVPDGLREKYFEPAGSQWCFRKDLRRSIIFGRNNLLHDAPISRIDLLACRNTLMYFNGETQGQILRRLHFALRPTGFLLLGKSEMLLTRRDLFEPIDLPRRIFTKVESAADRRGPSLLDPLNAAPVQAAAHPSIASRALELARDAVIVVGRDGTLLLANEFARRTLRLGAPDIGRPVQDLEVSYRPTELRAALDSAFVERRVVMLGPVTHRHAGSELSFEIRVCPLVDGDEVFGASVSFEDVSAKRVAETEVERARQELGAAYEELQSTVEELETTNEELQSTNEELETTNEELQSTNEELETMNEELASSNEELETTNDELRMRSLELREGNAVMEAILHTKGVGVIVVDRDERVRLWNEESEELWGLRREEVLGHPLREVDTGLPVDRLRPALRDVFVDGGANVLLELGAHDRRGREFACSVTVIPLSVDGGATGAIVLAERSA